MATVPHIFNGEHFVPLISDVPMRDNKDKNEKDVPVRDNEKNEENDNKRMKWSSKCEYLLSVVGYCVGLGNLWRFPYLVNRNGGGAFLIPFLICLVLCGFPLFFLESVLGQSTKRGVIQVWQICPLAKGIGFAMNVVNLLFYWYYMIIMAWALYYFVMSLQSVVPWSLCTDFFPVNNKSVGVDFMSLTNRTGDSDNSITDERKNSLQGFTSAIEEFWQHNVLQVSQGLEHPGHVIWYLAVALFTAHVICFLGLIKGIKSSGKVVYVTATAPYLLITVLLVRSAMLPGAVDGIIYYVKPDFYRLADPQVWMEAALQVFYSLGPAWGGIITMASYNKFHNNCYRDAVVLTFVCEGTSVYAGFAVFSTLGSMAHISGVHINKVVSSGPGLAFIVYPQAISLMPVPQIWAALFFFMIVMLGVDSLITSGEVILTSICDHFPHVMRRFRWLVTALFCATCFVAGLPFITQGGIFLFQLVDWFIGSFTTLLIGIIECIIVGWVYDGFSNDIQLMLGRKPPFFILVLWRFITPILLLVLFVVTLIKYETPTYGNYHYSTWGNVFGWSISTISFLPIPAVAAYQLWHVKGSLLQITSPWTRCMIGIAGMLFAYIIIRIFFVTFRVFLAIVYSRLLVYSCLLFACVAVLLVPAELGRVDLLTGKFQVYKTDVISVLKLSAYSDSDFSIDELA